MASLALVITFAIVFAWVGVTLVLHHHWSRFEADKKRFDRARLAHFTVSGLLFFFLGITLLALFS